MCVIGGRGDLYLTFLLDTVVPWAAARYRIATARDNIGIVAIYHSSSLTYTISQSLKDDGVE
jgi:hypothetical protein